MNIRDEKLANYFEEKWMDKVLPEAIKLASQMMFDGRSEDEALSAAKAIANVARAVGQIMLNQTED